MRRKNYFRVNALGKVETTTFNSRKKAHVGGWSTNTTVAKRRASIIPMGTEDRVKVLADSMDLEFNRDEMREKAKDLNIAGRGKMNKRDLCDAVAKAEVQAGA